VDAADVVVLGAGPAGVGAAYRAARAGHRVVVLERSTVPGGAAGSFEVAGIRVDHGSHRLHPSIDPPILAELRRLLGDELQERPRNGRIRLAGRWIAFPLRPGDLARRLPRDFALAAARDALTAPLRRPRRDTFAEVLRAGLGPTMCERFYFPYARKIWGVEPDELSGAQARRRVAAASPSRLLRRVLRGSREGRSVFHYPRGGFGRIVEVLAEAAAEAGAEFRYGTAVTGVDLAADGVRVRTDGGAAVDAARAWSTLPLPMLARLATPEPPAGLLAAAGQLEFRAMLLVYLVLDRPRYTEFDAHYLPEPSTPVTRVSEPRNYRDGGDPPDRTVLCAELPCTAGDYLWSLGDAELGALVEDGLARQGLPRPGAAAVHVRRLPHAYPVYRAGFERAFAPLDAWAGAQPRLLTFGRQGLFAHDNSHHALAMAWAAADALGSDGSFDDGAWAAARERFAAHVVED